MTPISSPSFNGVCLFFRKRMLLVHIDVDEMAYVALFIHQPLDAGEACLQFDNRLTDGGGSDFDQLLVVGQLPELGFELLWHKLNFKFSIGSIFQC